MPSDVNQRQAYDFLVSHLDDQTTFTKEQFQAVTQWEPKSFSTYWSKQFKPFVAETSQGRFRVTEAFRPFATWKRFRQHVSQVRRLAADYRRWPSNNVLSFEFFMPLSNEAHLKTTLDALFYKDTVLARLRIQDEAELRRHFAPEDEEAEDSYFDRVCEWVSKRFVGYSISHVSGRFRAAELATRSDAAAQKERYIVDETTAVTRFIFPCTDEAEADRIRWFFNVLFARSILELVGEDEVWMIESGMQSRLYVWRNEDADSTNE